MRVREPLRAVLHVECELMPGPYGVRRLRLQLRNQTQWHSIAGQDKRPDALAHSLIAAHLLVSVEGGAFVSQLDPPQWATGYVAACENVGVYPVLAGPPGSRALVLASPIILYDHPQVAPESQVAFCDATEMDEMLTLRTLTLTDEEKRQARGSDPRAAALIDHVEDLPPELLERLHGAIRSMTGTARRETPPEEQLPWWDPGQDADVSPETDGLLVAGTTVRRGVQVRLRPGTRSADAQDMFLVGRTATVAAVFSDVDGGSHLAVTLDDLAEDGYNPHGRYLYFAPDEVEPLGAACEP